MEHEEPREILGVKRAIEPGRNHGVEGGGPWPALVAGSTCAETGFSALELVPVYVGLALLEPDALVQPVGRFAAGP